MHDDITLTTGRVKRVLAERVVPAIISASMPLDVSAHHLPGEPIAPSEALDLEFEPFEVGTRWGPAWSTTWFKVEGSVPDDWRGRRVELRIDLGFDTGKTGFQCEGLVYRPDGQAVKSINPRNQWVPVVDEADGGERVDLLLEAAANPVLLETHPFLPTRQGDILTATDSTLYRTRRFDIVVVEPEVFELSLDLEVLLELQATLPKTAPRRMRILQALDDALDVLDLQRIAETATDARARLADALASPAEASAHRIAAVGHAHIDSAWLWPVRETIRKVARTASTMAQLIDDDDDFVYGMSSAQQYAWLKEHRPEVYERVKAAVAAGRFLPLGGMWVESDTVMPSGESLVRQFSQGQRFFEREFAIRSRGVWLPDSFGYSPALPQLMRRAGFEWFFTQKISWNQQNVFPHHSFLWEGIDGSRVFTHFPPMDTYNAQLSGAEVAKATSQFKESRIASSSIAPVGWGDGGGGTTREMTGKARRLADLEGSARVAWQHPDDFFDAARAELTHPAVWQGELYLELHRGTLTSQHATKSGNRHAEQALVSAELWAATAAVRLGAAYPFDELDAQWQRLLLHQFHDILPGTSIAWVHREAVEQLGIVVDSATSMAADAMRQLAGDGDVELVFTPHSVGGPAPLGAAAPPAPTSAATIAEDGDGIVLANEHVSVRISAEGLIVSAIDLATGRDAIPAGSAANLLQLHQDFPNKWDAWDVDSFYRNSVTDLRETTGIESRIDDGVAAVEVRRAFSSSTITQTISLAPDSRTVLLRNDIDWHETERLLKLAFPLDIAAASTEAETQFGFHRRPTHVNTSWEAAKFETSMHRFVLVREEDFGVAIVNDSVYGYDTTRDATDDDGVTTTVRVSLLRAPRFPDPETDHGRHVITVGLVIGADPTEATRAGIELGAPQVALRGGGPVEPLVRVHGRGIVVSAVKLADDRSGDVVVRVYESLGRRTTGSIEPTFEHRGVSEVSLLEDAPQAVAGTDLTLTPFEVRTLRFAR